MNHFRIDPLRASEFERGWRERESYLDRVPGFRSFHLLRGPEEEGAVVYASHTTWDSEEAFLDWTRSDAFRRAHAQGRTPAGVVLGPPRFVGWQSIDLES